MLDPLWLQNKLEAEKYSNIFAMCPSLRILIHDSHHGPTLACYVKDRMSNGVKQKAGYDCYCFPSPKIGNFVVDWLEYCGNGVFEADNPEADVWNEKGEWETKYNNFFLLLFYLDYYVEYLEIQFMK